MVMVQVFDTGKSLLAALLIGPNLHFNLFYSNFRHLLQKLGQFKHRFPQSIQLLQTTVTL